MLVSKHEHVGREDDFHIKMNYTYGSPETKESRTQVRISK